MEAVRSYRIPVKAHVEAGTVWPSVGDYSLLLASSVGDRRC